MRSITIAVAAHKPYRFPDDSAYLPLQVGSSLHPDVCLGIRRDNEGDSISEKNASYSELTALWWMWRNCDAGYKGLVHYRRYLGSPNAARRHAADRFDRIATQAEFDFLFEGCDIVLPRKRHYVIETVYSHYAHTFDARHFDLCRGVLAEIHPECVDAWDRHMLSRSAHILNMFVMRSGLFDSYCEWLFPVLAELERRVDADGYSAFESRWVGRVSERLLDPWLMANGFAFIELPVVSTEKVDWISKGKGFLKAKYLGEKYQRSF